jgi:hypothetical protein
MRQESQMATLLENNISSNFTQSNFDSNTIALIKTNRKAIWLTCP